MTETKTEGSNTTPIEPEKKSDVKADKTEEATPNKPEAEITTDPKPETKEEVKSEEPAEVKPISHGYLHKNTPKILKIWFRYYFAFGDDTKVPLDQLRPYHKKRVKRTVVPTTKTPGMVNATTTSEPSKTEEPVSEAKKPEEPVPEKVEETKKPEESTSDKVEETKKSEEPAPAKVEEAKKPEVEVEEAKKSEEPASNKAEEAKKNEDKKSETITSAEESNKVLYNNIAHATQTGKGLLFYYKSDSDLHKKQPLGIINLKDIEKVDQVDNYPSKPFAFNIVTCYGRTFELAADSKEDRERWIKTINEKIEAVNTINVESSDGYKDIHKKLVEGTAFLNVGSEKHPVSDSDVLSDDDADAPRDADKRKSVFASLSLFGKKPSTTETSVVPQSQSDDNDATREVDPEGNQKDEKTEETKEEGSSRSPPKSFLNLSIPSIPFGKKEKSPETKEPTNTETTTTTTKDGVTVEESTETDDTPANDAEATEENKEKQKKGWIENFYPFKKSSTPKEETPKEETPKEETPKEETSKQETPKEETSKEETVENKEATSSAEDRQKDQKDQKEKEKEGGLFKLFKGKARDETKVENPEASKAESTEDNTTSKSEEKTEAKVEEKSEKSPTEKQDKDTKEGVVRRVTQILRRSKSPKTDSTSREVGEDANKKEKTAEEKPADAEEKPAEEKPAEGKTADAEEKPAEEKPAEGEKPAEEKSDEEKKVDEPEVIPESSNSNASPENKGRKSSISILENIKRLGGIGGIGGKRQNSLPQESTQEKVEPETTAVTSPSEATDDVDNADKTRETTTKVEDKKKEPETAAQKQPVPEGLKQGNLHKQSQYLKIDELRYFVLTKEKLCYYRSSDDSSTQKAIDLSSDCKVKIPEVKVNHYPFDLETKGRTYKLYADSEPERDSWIEALKGCGVTFVPQHEKDPSNKKSDDVSTKLEVASENTNLKEEVDKAADAAAASVSATQEKTTKSTVTEIKETKEESKEEPKEQKEEPKEESKEESKEEPKEEPKVTTTEETKKEAITTA